MNRGRYITWNQDKKGRILIESNKIGWSLNESDDQKNEIKKRFVNIKIKVEKEIGSARIKN